MLAFVQTYTLGRTRACEVQRDDRPTTTGGSQTFNNNGSFLLAMLEFFIFFAWIMLLLHVFGDIFRSRDMGGGAKTVWSLFVVFLPFLGVFAYLLARGGGMTQRSLEAQQQMQERQAAYVRSVVAAGDGASSADQITAAKQLLDDGTITQSEFDQMKAKALAA